MMPVVCNRAVIAESVDAAAHRAAPREPFAVLRGGKIDVDPKRVHAVIAIMLVTVLGATGVTLLAASLEKNAQIGELRAHGVRVEITVARCLGLPGGSGSNAAGYACRGRYRFRGRGYAEAIPGNVLRRPGSEVGGVIAPSDPTLVSTEAEVRSEHASSIVFIFPIVLLVAFVLAVGALATRIGLVASMRRRTSSLRRP